MGALSKQQTTPIEPVTDRTLGPSQPRDTLRRLALLSIRESEDLRARIARALHDDLGQTLTVLNLHLYWLSRHCSGETGVLDKISEMQQVISCTNHAIRRLALDCRTLLPSAGATLRDIIESLVHQLESQHRLSVELRMPDIMPPLHDDYIVALSRILLGSLGAFAGREGLTACVLTVDYGCERITIELHGDAGRIAEPAALYGVREWLEALGGSYDTVSIGDEDVAMKMKLPLPTDEPGIHEDAKRFMART